MAVSIVLITDCCRRESKCRFSLIYILNEAHFAFQQFCLLDLSRLVLFLVFSLVFHGFSVRTILLSPVCSSTLQLRGVASTQTASEGFCLQAQTAYHLHLGTRHSCTHLLPGFHGKKAQVPIGDESCSMLQQVLISPLGEPLLPEVLLRVSSQRTQKSALFVFPCLSVSTKPRNCEISCKQLFCSLQFKF